jgi:hypothetical protein
MPENVHSTEASVHERLCVLPCGLFRCHYDIIRVARLSCGCVADEIE